MSALREWLRWINGWAFRVEVTFGFFMFRGTPITPPVPFDIRFGSFHEYDPRYPRKDWMRE